MKISFNYYKCQNDFIDSTKNEDKNYFIFIASKTKIDLNEFNKYNLKVVGARFPDIIYEGKLYNDGMIALEISENLELLLIKDINRINFENQAILESKSIIALLDGFCKNNEVFLSKLFENVGVNTNIIGGGAGLLDEDSDSIIFDNNGFYKNCAVLISLRANLKIGVKHGWSYLNGPLIATSCEKNILKTIDYIDAFEYYKKIIKEDCGVELNEENFLQVSQNYPIGIIKYQGEQIVRDPISFNNGSIELLGEISNNSMINILKGDKQDLLDASQKAIEDINCENREFSIVFNCISRKKFLHEDFQKELDSIFSHNSNMIGVTTLGEIANSGNRYINFLNKTCVVGAICN